MRVAILTAGRFHVCDLARELDRLGHDVAFYSLVPRWVTRRYGLPDRCNKWMGGFVAPLLAAWRLARGTALETSASAAMLAAIDLVAPKIVASCDVFIGMSGMSATTAEMVRRRYSASVLVERGSRHILSQQEILESIPGCSTRSPIDARTVRREMADYAVADRIVVPSEHVLQSFIDRGTRRDKLFVNPYGVDLDMFPPTLAPTSDPPTILFVGAWSLRKGCDVLTEAWRRLPGTRLLHVGPLGDAAVPRDPGFEHREPVPQFSLSAEYARGHVFAMASREEGLALVQSQALASGLPLVCTDRTGGEDLRGFLTDASLVSVVPSEDPVALADALEIALVRACTFKGRRDLLGSGRGDLSWQAYGKRYDQALRDEA